MRGTMQSLASDLRTPARELRKRPGFTSTQFGLTRFRTQAMNASWSFAWWTKPEMTGSPACSSARELLPARECVSYSFCWL